MHSNYLTDLLVYEVRKVTLTDHGGCGSVLLLSLLISKILRAGVTSLEGVFHESAIQANTVVEEWLPMPTVHLRVSTAASSSQT